MIAIGVLLIAIVGPWVTGDPLARDLDHGLSPLGAPRSPSADAWLGTDPLGRDVLARLVSGAGTSLWIAGVATAIATVIGVAVGMVAGYRGGWIDAALMRTVDLVLAFPVVLVAILLATLLRSTSLASSSAPVILTMAAVTWTALARVVRSKTLVVRTSTHVLAARALGATTTRILVRHVLPNLAGVIAAFAILGFSQNFLFEAMLSYLGLGPPPPAPTWGRMIYEAHAYYRTSPHLVLAPGLAIVITVVGFGLLGDGLRARFAPKERA